MHSRQSILTRHQLKSLIDSHLYEQLNALTYRVAWLDPRCLLTSNRLDLAFRLFYLSRRHAYPDLASDIYSEDIRAQSLGTFKDPHNPKKTKQLDFQQSFNLLADSIRANSFTPSHGLIPLACDGSILNGAHRIASSIYYQKQVLCVFTELQPYLINDLFYSRRGVSDTLISAALREYIEYSRNTYIACLWPSSYAVHNQAITMIPNIISLRKLQTNSTTALATLHLCYQGMDWMGNSQNSFTGLYSKLYETFPRFSDFNVVAFTAQSLDEVQLIKKRIRSLTNLEYSSIHITDTPAEAITLSRVLFNPSHYELLSRVRGRPSFASIRSLTTLLDVPHPPLQAPCNSTPIIDSEQALRSTISSDNHTFLLQEVISNPSLLKLDISFTSPTRSYRLLLVARLTSAATSFVYHLYVLKYSIRGAAVVVLKRLSLYGYLKKVFKKPQKK